MSSAKSKNRLDQFAVVLAAWMIKLRWLVIIAALGLAAYIGSGAQYLAYSNNYRAFFSEDNPELNNFEEFQATYTKSDNFQFVLVPKDGSEIFTNANLAAIAELTEESWRLPYVTRVDSVTNFQYTYAVGDELIVEDLIVEPGESAADELAARKQAALDEPLLNGLLLTPDAAVTAVNITLTYPEESLTEVPEAVAAARELRDQILAAHPQFDIYLTGTSMLSNAFSEAIFTDFKTLIPAMIALIIVTTILAVRSVGATLATVAVVVLSTTIAMGWAGFAGIELAGPSPSAVIVILTLAIADSIHILISLRTAMRNGLARRPAIIEAIRINFLAVMITSITTIVGFMALNFADSPPFRDFGNISAVGILAAWILSMTFLPAALSFIPFRFEKREAEKRSGFLRGLADFVIARHRTLLALTGAGVVALIAMIPTIALSDQFHRYFNRSIEFRNDTDEMMKHFGFYPIEFSVKAGEPGGVSDPEFLKTLEEYTDWLRGHPDVFHVYSLTDIMKRLNKNLNADDPDYYRVPDDRELSAQYLLLFELSLPYGLDLNDRINIDKSSTRVTATMKPTTTTKDVRQFIAQNDAWFENNAPQFESPPTGATVMFTFIAMRNIQSMIVGTLIAVGAIAVIMMLALRSPQIGLLSMAPNGLPILAAFGAWAVLVGEVGFSVAAVASLSLGIVIDDTVHFLTKYMRARRENGYSPEDSIRYAFETVGAAIIFNTLILASGFALLAFSAFKINAEMGLLTTLTIGLALILDFLMLPGILLLTARRNQNIQTTKGDFDAEPSLSAS